MASDFPTSGDALRKLIHKSRAMPVSFGFNPGTTEAGDEYFAAHPRKTPELLGKLALTEGAGTKSAFGTFVIDASELHLTCFRTLPQLAKKVKKYLKSNKITLNVVVMDADGQVLDSDVEVLTGWEASLAEAGAEAEPAPGAAPEAPAPRGKDTDVYIPPGFATEPDAPVNAREEKRAEAEAIDPSLAALAGGPCGAPERGESAGKATAPALWKAAGGGAARRGCPGARRRCQGWRRGGGADRGQHRARARSGPHRSQDAGGPVAAGSGG